MSFLIHINFNHQILFQVIEKLLKDGKKVFQVCVKGIYIYINREIRRLTVPSKLAYGENGASNLVPPNATIIYDIELLSITKNDK